MVGIPVSFWDGLFSPSFAEDSHFDSYFLMGLTPPTSFSFLRLFYFWGPTNGQVLLVGWNLNSRKFWLFMGCSLQRWSSSTTSKLASTAKKIKVTIGYHRTIVVASLEDIIWYLLWYLIWYDLDLNFIQSSLPRGFSSKQSQQTLDQCQRICQKTHFPRATSRCDGQTLWKP